MIGRFFVYAAVLSLATLPLVRIYGVPVPLLLAAVSGGFLIADMIGGRIRIRKVALMPVLSVISFIGAFSVSSLVHDSGYRLTFELWAYALCFLVVFIYVGSCRHGAVVALMLLGWVAVIVATVGVYYFLQDNMFWVQAASEGLGTRNSDAFMMWAGLPYWFIQWRVHKGWKQVIYLLLAIFLIVAIALTASRGAFLIALLISFFFLALKWRMLRLSIVVVLTLVPVASCIDWGGLEGSVFLVQRLQKNISEDERMYLVKSAWAIISDHPVLGTGHDSPLIQSALAQGRDDHFHNAFLQLWAEGGLVLPILFFSVIIAPLLASWMQGKLTESSVVGVILSLALVAEMFISVFYNWIFFWFLLAISYVLLLNGMNRSVVADREIA